LEVEGFILFKDQLLPISGFSSSVILSEIEIPHMGCDLWLWCFKLDVEADMKFYIWGEALIE